MSDYRALNVPQNIVRIGEHVLKGVGNGIFQDTVTDDGGHKMQFSFDAVVVRGMGSDLFSVTTTMQKGITTLFHPDKPRLEYDDVVLPMNVLGIDEATARQLCSFDLELGGGCGGLALRAAPADLCHRRMGHINRKTWMFCGNRRAMVSSTAGTYRHVMSAPLVRVSNKLILSRQRMIYSVLSS